jgi:glycosyltransferase involved in cell wall biosynthesis
MQILYGSSCCGKNAWDALLKNKATSGYAVQKYHGLLLKGLAANSSDVNCFSALPVNRTLTKKTLIRIKDETENNVCFHYISTVNLPLLKRLTVFFGSFFGVLFTKRKPDTFIVCDCLNVANAYGMMLAGKLKKIPVATIVTDLPDMMSQSGITRRINNRFFKSVDGFIILTEQMNARINLKAKPFVVLEGHVDSALGEAEADKKEEQLSGKKVVVYAGSVNRIYGIENLVEGFLLSNLDNAELRVYGDGDYAEKVKETEKKYSSVKYMGVCDNSEVVKAEQSAALLVNPRPAAPEYTKYSFPSKNMEYMVSGTPVLTTKLPGMPKEYYPYVYLLEDETPMGVSDALREIFSLTADERGKKGQAARRFVLEHKSNVIQAKRIIDFLMKEVKR